MGYNEKINLRIARQVSGWKNCKQKKMFGGICHLMNGHMFGGVYKDFLILRLGEEPARKALKQPHTKPFDITGSPMKGWVMVEQDGFREEEELKSWLDRARRFVLQLPSK
jgi:TfoX/Sxy family transcriptional regulator of competence genes